MSIVFIANYVKVVLRREKSLCRGKRRDGYIRRLYMLSSERGRIFPKKKGLFDPTTL